MGDGHDLPDPALGVFDTLLVRDGRPVDLDRHVDRLARSVRELYGVPVEPADLRSRMTAAAQGAAATRLRTTYRPWNRTWEVEASEVAEPGLDPRRLAVRRLPAGLGPHKWVDRRLVDDPGDADDVLVVDARGQVLECGTANVFVVLRGIVVTPPLDGRILPGTVRDQVLARLAGCRRAVEERELPLTELAQAAEVFTTSSVRGVQPVIACLELASWATGPTATWLRAGFAAADS